MSSVHCRPSSAGPVASALVQQQRTLHVQLLTLVGHFIPTAAADTMWQLLDFCRAQATSPPQSLVHQLVQGLCELAACTGHEHCMQLALHAVGGQDGGLLSTGKFHEDVAMLVLQQLEHMAAAWPASSGKQVSNSSTCASGCWNASVATWAPGTT